MLKVNNFNRNRGNLLVKNNLSKKPSKSVEKVRQIVLESGYNMSLKQDYSRNVVEMDLLGVNYGNNNEYHVYQSRKIPVTSAVNTYTKNAQEMIEIQNEYFRVVNSRIKQAKPTFFERIQDYIEDFLVF